MLESAAKRFLFNKKSLSSPCDAEIALKAFSQEIKDGAKICLDMSQVDELSDAYANTFFGPVAADLVVNGVSMQFEFKKGLGFEFTTRIQEALNRALPPSLGGHATVH